MNIYSVWCLEKNEGFIWIKDESGLEKTVYSQAKSIHELRPVAEEFKRIVDELSINSLLTYLDYEEHIYSRISDSLKEEMRELS